MVTIIAAVAANNVIGKRNDLPWYLPEDLKRFKELTAGHPVVMGRKTFESILARLGKPLPGRPHFVLTRNPAKFELPSEWPEEAKLQVHACTSLDEALKEAEKLDSEIFIIGGEKVFEEGITRADKLELTEVNKDYEGDAFFPEFNKTEWVRTIVHPNNDFTFVTYIRA